MFRYLFWTGWGFESHISRVGMDGSNRTVVISSGLVWPNALTVDHLSDRIWWADANLHYIGSVFITNLFQNQSAYTQ